jgi:hypothetical protein
MCGAIWPVPCGGKRTSVAAGLGVCGPIGAAHAIMGPIKCSIAAEIYRPWCVQYQGSRSGSTSCAFTSFEQCMMTGGPGTGGVCVQNPWYLWYGAHGPTTGQSGRIRRW